MRKVISAFLIVLGCVLAPVALFGFWTAHALISPGRYVESVAPMARNSDIQDAVANRVTGVMTQRLRGLGVSAAGDLVRTSVRAKVTGDGFPTAWEEMNRGAHRRFLAVLYGEGSREPTLRSDTVSLDLHPVCELARQELLAAGLGTAARLPELHPTIRLALSADLIRVAPAQNLLVSLKWILPFLPPALMTAGVLLARDRETAVVGAGLGLAGGMFLLALALSLARNVYLPGSTGHTLPVAAAVVFFDAVTGTLRTGVRVFFAAGLLVAGTVFVAKVGVLRARLPVPPPPPMLTSLRRPRRMSPWVGSRAGRERP
ncbi:hypothetical protein GCM10010517_00680 [Streptosporangium fragile]|uniref:Uncharacterized protein n=1 Tax=Streptosporangium fragile TaxID=46186 RepID=A0ABN3VNK5_9ACTN